jgi:hypothetical protein
MQYSILGDRQYSHSKGELRYRIDRSSVLDHAWGWITCIQRWITKTQRMPMGKKNRKPRCRGIRNEMAPSFAKYNWAKMKANITLGANVRETRQKYKAMEAGAIKEIEEKVALGVLVTERNAQMTETEELQADIRKEGDAEQYTKENLMKRKALRHTAKVRAAIKPFWELPLEKDDQGNLTKSGYVAFNVALHSALIPAVTPGEALRSAEGEWLREGVQNEGKELLYA